LLELRGVRVAGAWVQHDGSMVRGRGQGVFGLWNQQVAGGIGLTPPLPPRPCGMWGPGPCVENMGLSEIALSRKCFKM